MLEGKREFRKALSTVSKYLVFLATVPFVKLFTFFELTHLFLTNDLST